MSNNLIACRPGCYGKYKEEAFRHLPTIGIRHVELGAPSKEEWPAIQEELTEFGLKASSVGGSADLSQDACVETFTHIADTAKAFNSSVIFLSVKTGGIPKKDAYSKLRQLGDIARDRHATIALETHPDLVTNGDEAIETMEGTSHPSVKLNYDSANLYYYNEGIDGIAELKKFLPWLGAVHLKETNGKFKSWYFPGLGEGDGIVDFPEIFNICGEIGFHGPFTMEIEGIKGEELTKEQALERMANSAKYLKSIQAMA